MTFSKPAFVGNYLGRGGGGELKLFRRGCSVDDGKQLTRWTIAGYCCENRINTYQILFSFSSDRINTVNSVRYTENASGAAHAFAATRVGFDPDSFKGRRSILLRSWHDIFHLHTLEYHAPYRKLQTFLWPKALRCLSGVWPGTKFRRYRQATKLDQLGNHRNRHRDGQNTPNKAGFPVSQISNSKG